MAEMLNRYEVRSATRGLLHPPRPVLTAALPRPATSQEKQRIEFEAAAKAAEAKAQAARARLLQAEYEVRAARGLSSIGWRSREPALQALKLTLDLHNERNFDIRAFRNDVVVEAYELGVTPRRGFNLPFSVSFYRIAAPVARCSYWTISARWSSTTTTRPTTSRRMSRRTPAV